MGFHNRRISFICSCIQIVSFSVLVNGEPRGNFTPKRGLRQGDSLSPYLFLLCVEGLHSLIQQAETLGAIKESLFAMQAQKFHICSLLMTAYCFIKQLHKSVPTS